MVQIVRNSPSLPTHDRETAIVQKSQQQARQVEQKAQRDRVEKQASQKKQEEIASPGLISQIGSTLWQWVSYPFSSLDPSSEGEGSKVHALQPSSPLTPPQPIHRTELDPAMKELIETYQQLEAIESQSVKGPIDKVVFERYEKQRDIHKVGIDQSRLDFAAKHLTKKAQQKEYTNKVKEYDSIGQEGKWWGNLTSQIGKGVIVTTAAVAGYVLWNAPNVQGLKDVGNLVFTWGLPAFGITEATQKFAQSHFDYKAALKEGEAVLLRHKHTITDLKLRDLIDFMSNNWGKFNDQFVQQYQIVLKRDQTIRSLASQ